MLHLKKINGIKSVIIKNWHRFHLLMNKLGYCGWVYIEWNDHMHPVDTNSLDKLN